jgi:parallel beta-helix repeat protein
MNIRLASLFITLTLTSTLYPQGSLTPPGAPAPTMKTLQQVEPRIDISTVPGHPTIPERIHEITVEGSYYLTEDLVTNSDVIVINVAVSNVTIDLNGFTIRQTGAQKATAIRLNPYVDQVVIKNGIINGFSNGILADFTNENCRVEDMHITNVSWGCSVGPRSIVSNCQLSGSGTTNRGISVNEASIVKNCTVVGFQNYGVYSTSGCTITNVTVRGCGGGIYTGQGTLVSGCSIYQTSNAALYGIYGTAWSTIRDCRLLSCAYKGIYVSSDSLIDGCIVYNSTDTGISTGVNSQVLNSTVSNAGGNLGGIYARDNSIIENCIAKNCSTTGIRAQIGSTIKDCFASSNAENGIYQYGDGGVIESCESIDNGANGISGGDDVVISNCTSTGNSGSYGIYTGRNARVLNCTVASNKSSTTYGSGIWVGDQSSVSGCTVADNTSTAVPNTFNQGMGIRASNYARIEGCMVSGNSGDGIQVGSYSTVINNTCTRNGIIFINDYDGAGIHVNGSYGVIEGNILQQNERGIEVSYDSNMIIKNKARGNSFNYRIVAGNSIGTLIVPGSNAVLVNGSTGASGLGTVDPYANFSY